MSRQVGAKRQQYSTTVLEEAAGLVRSESISLNRAAKQYNIPKTTLQNAVHYKYSSHKVGQKTVLTSEEERRIVDWAIHMARIGYGRTRQELANTVKKILDDDGRPNPFKDNRPGKEWLARFFARHPDLSLRTSIQLGKERAIVSADKINQWFSDFRKYIQNEVGDADLLKDPSRIYNADETGVSLCMKGNQVIGMKGAPVVYHYGNSDKTQITVMAACSAVGHYIPPMLVFPGQRFSYNPLEGFEEAALGRSDNGWMDAEVFCEWLENVFIPAINERKVKRPVLLLIDGHVTHVTMRASDICIQNEIEMYCLLEHASHVLQPLDLRFFSSLKKSWRQSVRDWQSEHIGEYVTKQNFAQIFKKAWTQSTTIEAAVKGFLESGLFPIDPSIVASSVKLEPSKMFLSDPVLSNTKCQDSNKDDSAKAESKSAETNDDASDQTQVKEQDMQQHEHSEKTAESPKPSCSKQNDNETNVNQASPFSKHLNIPTPKTNTKCKAVKKIVMPKAITGSAYRKLMEEKQKRKEEEQEKKEHRKAEREAKRKLKEEENIKRKAEAEAKRRKRAEDKQKKRALREKLLQYLENSDSDSDTALEVDKMMCYTCELPYSTDFIECSSCFRRFHIECVEDDYLNIDGLPFECKYC